MNTEAVWIDAHLKRDLKIQAAQEGTSMREVAERTFRLGLVASRLAAELCALVEAFDIGILHADLRENAQAALASFEAAQEPTP